MKIPRILTFVLIAFILIGSASANSEKVNNLILGKTMSDIIYEISEDIIENRTEIVSISVSDTLDPFQVKFISSDYAILNNITCDDGNCTLFGQYNPLEKTIYVLPETISDYYNHSALNLTLAKISNTFYHELSHHYQYEDIEFMLDMIDSLNMSTSYISGTLFTLNNYGDYQGFNLSDVPDSIKGTVDFPDALSTYSSNEYVREIQVRIIALCFQEKHDYEFYWNMIEVKDYQVCEMYEFPIYLDNNLAYDTRKFAEAYVVQYLGLDITLSNLEELEETSESIFVVLLSVASGINILVIPLAVMSIIGILITGFILIIKMFGTQIGKIFKFSFK